MDRIHHTKHIDNVATNGINKSIACSFRKLCVFFFVCVGLFSRSASFYFIYEYYSLPNIVLYAFISPVDSKDFIIIIQCFELLQTDHMNTHTHTELSTTFP